MVCRWLIPDATVACITGETSIRCVSKSLLLASSITSLENYFAEQSSALGMVRQWQQIDYADVTRILYGLLPDFTKLVEAYGHVGMKIENP